MWSHLYHRNFTYTEKQIFKVFFYRNEGRRHYWKNKTCHCIFLPSFPNFPKNTQLFKYFPLSLFFFSLRISSDRPKNKPGSELSCFEPLPAVPAGSMQSKGVPISEGPFGIFCGLSALSDGILFYWGSPPISHPQIFDLKCLNYYCKTLREQKEQSKAVPSCLVFNSTPSSSFSVLT